jgi:hypothetical protein
MALGETLRFFIDLNADGAIREADKFGTAVETNTKKGSSSIDNFSRNAAKFGTAAVGFGGAILYGLSKTVEAYSAAEQEHLKLTNAIGNSSQKFKDNGDAVAKAAQHLQTYTTVEGDAAEGAAAMLVQFGLTEKQVTDLLPLVGDLSRKMGIDMEQAAKAVGKAAEGAGAGGLTRMGIVVDQLAYKADPAKATLDALQKTVGGFAQAEAGTAAGKIEMLKNNLQDIAEGVGAGAADVLGAVVGPLTKIAEKGGAAGGALEGIGKAGAILGAGSVIVGGLSLAASAASKLRDRFTEVQGAGDDATRSLNGMGKAAAGIGIIGGALAFTEMALAINKATQNADDFETKLNELKATSQKTQIADIFNKQAKDMEGIGDKFMNVFSASFRQGIDWGPFKAQVDNMNEALDKLTDEDKRQALKEINALLAAAPKHPDNGSVDEKEIDNLKKRKSAIEESLSATDKAAKATGDLTQSEQDAQEAAQEWTDALKDNNGALGLMKVATDDAAAAGKGLADAFEAQDTDEQVTSALKLGDAFGDVKDSVKDLPHTFDEMTAATGGYTDEQSKAIKAVTDWGDAAKDQIQTLIQSGATSDQVTAKAGVYRDSLTKVMQQAGLTDDQIHTYLQTLGLTPEQVETAVKLSGDAEAKFKLGLYQTDLANLPKSVSSDIRADINDGKYQEAWNTLNNYKKGVEAPVTPVIHDVVGLTRQLMSLGVKPAGSSAVVPSSAPAVGATATAPVVVQVPAPNISITMPAGATPANTLAAIRRYQRLGGDMGGLLDTAVAIR